MKICIGGATKQPYNHLTMMGKWLGGATNTTMRSHYCGGKMYCWHHIYTNVTYNTAMENYIGGATNTIYKSK